MKERTNKPENKKRMFHNKNTAFLKGKVTKNEQKTTRIVFPKFRPPDANIQKFWPQIRILCKTSSLEPAGNV